MDLYTLKLEDGKEYIIIDTIVNNNNKYFILTTEDNEMTIRKVVNVNGEEGLSKLDNRDEMDMIMTLYYEKNKGETNEE